MQRTPDADPVVAPARASGPDVAPEMGPDGSVAPVVAPQAAIHLAPKPDAAMCPFWIGLAVAGPLTPAALLDQPDLASLLTAAATTGLADVAAGESVMLSDAATNPARQVFLVPVPGESFRERATWTVQLVEALRAWAPPVVGLAFGPEAVPTPRALELMVDVLRAAIEGGMRATFHLHCSGHGITGVLNAALRLKAELEAEGHGIYVFH